MIKKINLQTISAITFLFLLFQLTIINALGSDYFDVFGVFHYVALGLFILFFVFSQKVSIRNVFFLVLLYQLILVLALYFFYVEAYNSPLGFEPTDEIFYNNAGDFLKNKSFSRSIDYLKQRVGISDFGFPLAVKFIYSLGGNEIFNMKIFNVSFHLLSCFFLFKTSRRLFDNSNFSKTFLIFYGLNPISIYFNASGRKEPLFLFIIAINIYCLYKAVEKKDLKFYILAFLTVLATGMFRTIFPVFFLLSFGFYFFLENRGKYKNLIRAGYLIMGSGLIFMAVLFVREDLSQAMNINQFTLATARIGRAPTLLDYSVLTISGIIGPFPSFSYNSGNDSALLQTVGNTVKLCLSFFFLIGLWRVIKEKRALFYPLLLFIAFNIAMLVTVAASLDHRFIYPFIPAYFLVLAYGFNHLKEQGKMNLFLPFLGVVIVLVIGYNFR